MAQIRAAFRKSPSVMTKNLDKAIKKVVITVERGSIQNAPVDTGRLRSSHYAKFSRLRGEVGTDVEYDNYVHDGTKFMKARPYLQKSVDDNQSAIDKEFENAVQDTLDTLARSIG